jgi:hypothetical protein
MAEFSAHRVTLPAGDRVAIATDLNLYVSPYGDDVINTGTDSSSPFKTIERAIQWLGDKYISKTGFVTINFAAGIYDLTSELVLDHPEGERIALVGAEPETLILQSVDSYKTRGFTADQFSPFYSNTRHLIGIKCVRPDDSAGYAEIDTGVGSLNSMGLVENGYGVIVEDYDFVYNNSYNPIGFYTSFPNNARNLIVRGASIMGCHKLIGASGNGSFLTLESTIRDDWMAVPSISSGQTIRYFWGNAQNGVTYDFAGIPGGYCGNASDVSEDISNNSLNNARYKHTFSTVPIGYYGTVSTSGIPASAVANVIGLTLPLGQLSPSVGGTANFTQNTIYEGNGTNRSASYSYACGSTYSFINDTILLGNGNNHHKWDALVSPPGSPPGFGNTLSLRTNNSNRITVKVIPTVFRRFGNIISIPTSGLRKIKNIFFNGKNMCYHYGMISSGLSSTESYSNKMAIHASNSKLGEAVENEPSGLGSGLCTNVGIANFHTAVFCDNHTRCNLGKIVASNCSFGIYANDGSSVQTSGSVCTGIASNAFSALNSSTMTLERCYSAFTGQSLVTLKLKSGGTFAENSFIPGQTYSSPDGKITGTVWDWNSRDRVLNIAVRVGLAEGGDPKTQR